MSVLFWIIVGIVGAAAYAFVGTLIAVLAHQLFVRKRWLYEKTGTAATVGAFWPIAWAIIVGLLVGQWFTGFEDRQAVKERREQAEHQRKVELAREESKRNESALRLLEAEGIRARVDA